MGHLLRLHRSALKEVLHPRQEAPEVALPQELERQRHLVEMEAVETQPLRLPTAAAVVALLVTDRPTAAMVVIPTLPAARMAVAAVEVLAEITALRHPVPAEVRAETAQVGLVAALLALLVPLLAEPARTAAAVVVAQETGPAAPGAMVGLMRFGLQTPEASMPVQAAAAVVAEIR